MSNPPMTRKPITCCAICEKSNLPSICAVCVNFRLNEYSSSLKALKSQRDALYKRLSEALLAKSKADDQKSWMLAKNEKLARMKEKMQNRQRQLLEGKGRIELISRDLEVKFVLVESAMSVLKKNQADRLEKSFPNLIHTLKLGYTSISKKLLLNQSAVLKQICRLFPLHRANFDGERKDGFTGHYDTVCGARLPQGLDPHSVPSEELAASLGYMVQLLNLVVHTVCAPALHNSGFAGSCSRIWQRDSYWDARPSSRSSEYPLFIPRQNICAGCGEASWSGDRSSSNFGVASMESDRKSQLDIPGRNSFNFSSASPHSMETHKDLQKGILLLKKSVACINAYGYNLLCLDVPTDSSTFESLARLMATLSSIKEGQSIASFKMACSRSNKQSQQLNKSSWDVDDSAIASSTLMESLYAAPSLSKNMYVPSSGASLMYTTELSDGGKKENMIEGWDLVEHPKYPPPPSQTEDIEHWTRAMFIDATKKKKNKK